MRGHAFGPFGTLGNLRVQYVMALDVILTPNAQVYVNASPTDPVKITFAPWVFTTLANGTNALTVGNSGNATAYYAGGDTSTSAPGAGTNKTFTLTANTTIVAALTSAAIAASKLLTFTGRAIAGDTVTFGATTYTFRASVSTTANEVKVGASTTAQDIANLIAAVTGGAGSGTVYGSLTVANATVTASAGAGTSVLATAKTAGTAGNSIAIGQTMTNATWAGGATTLSGGDSASAAGAITVFLDT